MYLFYSFIKHIYKIYLIKLIKYNKTHDIFSQLMFIYFNFILTLIFLN
jgi:hypothetical protein